jgi:hypothetical protein
MVIRIMLAVALLLWSPSAEAQNGGNPGGGQNGGGQNGGGQFPGGILITPGGLIRGATTVKASELRRDLRQAAQKQLPSDLNQVSPLRCVSLKGLDEALTASLQRGEELSPEIRHLAGLTQVDWVVIDTPRHDIIIAGPAEGFASLPGGRSLGVESGRPVLCLDDLLVSLRLENLDAPLGCSIDPDAERLAASQTWLSQNSSPAARGVAQQRLEHMVALQGEWNITTFGLPEGCRMSLAMIEADYLMKRLAIGVDQSGIRGFRSSFALAKPGDNMMRRWWFAPKDDFVQCDKSRTMFRFSGARLQLLAQEELMDANGNLTDAGFTQTSSEQFAKLFSEKLPLLAEKIPAFADLQNILDLTSVATILRMSGEQGLLDWQPNVLAADDKLAAATYAAPTTTMPMLNVKMSGGSLIIGAFSGGVSLRPQHTVNRARIRTRTELSVPQPSFEKASTPDRWWWNAEVTESESPASSPTRPNR